ncbi:recombinase family protein [Vibrio nitrifigilis]|nr:recombinase family protein [Vibrio nitrifigilis]MBF9003210.1 recombinase family protein [Vibrio nitrifigilis]
MTKCYGYIRISPKINDIDNRIEAFSAYQNDIELFKETGVRGGVPLSERSVFTELDTKLIKGDELVVWWIDELGKEFSKCLNNIKLLIGRGITIKTIVQNLEFKQDDQITDALVKMMQGFAESEKHKRLFAAELGRRSLKKDSEGWKAKFRGRKINKEMHEVIAQALFEGKTLQTVADETGASISTVKRVKAKIKDDDELGHLRSRSHRHGGRCGERRHGEQKGHSPKRGYGNKPLRDEDHQN